MVATLTPEQAVRLSALVDLSISLPASVPDSRGCIEGVVRRADHILTESAPPHILARLSGGGRTHTEPNSTDPADHADSDDPRDERLLRHLDAELRRRLGEAPAAALSHADGREAECGATPLPSADRATIEDRIAVALGKALLVGDAHAHAYGHGGGEGGGGGGGGGRGAKRRRGAFSSSRLWLVGNAANDELLGLGGDDRDPEGRSRDRDLDDLDDDLDDLDPDIDVDLRSLDEGERQRRRRRRRRRRSENKDKSDAQLAVVAAAVAMATAVGAAFLFLRAFLLNGGGGPGGMGGRAGGKGGSPTGGKVAKEANAFTKRGLRREALVGEGSFGKVRVCGGRGGACIRERA